MKTMLFEDYDEFHWSEFSIHTTVTGSVAMVTVFWGTDRLVPGELVSCFHDDCPGITLCTNGLELIRDIVSESSDFGELLLSDVDKGASMLSRSK